ncbi:MAG: OmpA family protein [Muribaculaceae bacterium]|nr:OmpA family protein [Muribaculaceae bacterium]
MRQLYYIIIFLFFASLFTGCKTPKLSEANEKYERGEYFNAANTYRKVYNKLTKREERKLRGEVAFQMGECYRRLNMSARASAAYQNAVRYEYADSMVYFYLGRQLQNEGKYIPAIKAYNDFLERLPDDKRAKEGIRGCELAVKWKKNPTRYVVKNAKLFNSRRSDFAPMFHGDNNNELFFSSTTEKAMGTNKSEITGTKKSDIFFSKKNERGEWQRPEPIEGEVNTELDEGIISFTPDGNTMYITKARRELNANTSVEIYTSQRSDAKWSAPVKYEITADTLSAYGHPAISADGKSLYFSSDMPGGFGGKDIWRISLTERAGSLENMGEQINTAGDEMFPYCRTDNVIYFASDGHAGVGGLDIFKATQGESGHWNVENMGIPMNSPGDDFGITFDKGEFGYFSSNRNDARGYDHIYSFDLPEIKVTISGSVLDKDEEPVANAIIRIVGNDGSNQKEIARKDGTFKFKLDRGVKYVMLAGARGYLNAKQEFVSDIAEEDADYGIDFILAAIHKPQVVENIFYDFDKATLRPESKASLDTIAQMLRDNPNVAIEMASHTDRIGSNEYNNSLSQRRAKSVVDYLVSIGVKPDRLQPQGYGKTRPKKVTKRIARLFPQFKEEDVLDEEFILKLSPEDQEAADQINRRTEFQVLSITYDMY